MWVPLVLVSALHGRVVSILGGLISFACLELSVSSNPCSRDLAEKLATATIDTYTDIVQDMLDAHPADSVTEHERELQLAYHTAYFYQVLFLDCGTTAGLLTHAENDVG
ncbi:unnamed protein product, partial [Prorocentrum cordatum]